MVGAEWASSRRNGWTSLAAPVTPSTALRVPGAVPRIRVWRDSGEMDSPPRQLSDRAIAVGRPRAPRAKIAFRCFPRRQPNRGHVHFGRPGDPPRFVRSPGSMTAHPPRSVFAFDLVLFASHRFAVRHLMWPSAPSDGSPVIHAGSLSCRLDIRC